MRATRTIGLLMATALVALTFTPPAKADVDVSFSFFYSDLRPHGNWLVSARYGRVWQPAVYSPGWNPYYDGHWVCTDLGWTWVSDYDWGAVPYHYGTWVLDPRFGWVWVPGYTWAPSWVVFRTGPDYIGWAPVSPHYSIGASFTFADDPNLFVFVGAGDFLAPRVRTRVVPIERTRTVIRNTTIVNNFTIENDIVVNRGPDVRAVERATGKKIDVTPIERVRRVAPSDRIAKSDLRVKREKGALRAAEPVRADQPLPGSARGVSGKSDRERPGKPQLRPMEETKQKPQKSRGNQEARAQQKQQKSSGPHEAKSPQKTKAEKSTETEQKAKRNKADGKKKNRKDG